MARRDQGRGDEARGATLAPSAKARFTEIVLVCAKCAKRQGLGKRAARGLLKRGLKSRFPERRVKIVETGCLGPCPKRALAVATGGSIASGRILLIDPATPPEAAADAVLSMPCGARSSPISAPKRS